MLCDIDEDMDAIEMLKHVLPPDGGDLYQINTGAILWPCSAFVFGVVGDGGVMDSCNNEYSSCNVL